MLHVVDQWTIQEGTLLTCKLSAEKQGSQSVNNDTRLSQMMDIMEEFCDDTMHMQLLLHNHG
jgi:hypothetical protein